MKSIYTKENSENTLKIISLTKKILRESDIKLKKIEKSINSLETYINKINV